mgnify:CR=1 FL=1
MLFIAISAPIHLMIFIIEIEDMRKLLLDRGNAARSDFHSQRKLSTFRFKYMCAPPFFIMSIHKKTANINYNITKKQRIILNITQK